MEEKCEGNGREKWRKWKRNVKGMEEKVKGMEEKSEGNGREK